MSALSLSTVARRLGAPLPWRPEPGWESAALAALDSAQQRARARTLDLDDVRDAVEVYLGALDIARTLSLPLCVHVLRTTGETVAHSR